MNRLLQQCYSYEYLNSPSFLEISSQFKKDLQNELLTEIPLSSVYTDLVVQYLLNKTNYISTSFLLKRILTIYKKCSPLTPIFLTWLRDSYLPELKEKEFNIREDLKNEISKYEEEYKTNPNYPIYTKTFSYYHKTLVRLKQNQFCLFQLEFVLKKEEI
jgi:hypothetical protein